MTKKDYQMVARCLNYALAHEKSCEITDIERTAYRNAVNVIEQRFCAIEKVLKPRFKKDAFMDIVHDRTATYIPTKYIK